jgi:chemotaxis protein methyltransferase CheR
MELTPQTFGVIAGMIHEESGVRLGAEKAYLLRHRLAPLIREQGLSGFDELADKMRMQTGTRMRQHVIDAITVKETRFFRDQSCFEAIAEYVLPHCAGMLDGVGKPHRRARIWSAASSTGQEAYSLAMLAIEFAEANAAALKNAVPFNVMGSDISEDAVAYAKAGHYSDAEVHRGLSTERLRCFFRRHGTTRWSVTDAVRRLVQFRTFNLLRPPESLGPFNLILCRNVLIYFDDATRRRVIRGLYGALADGGWLALGSAESLYGLEHKFETIVRGKTILYRKTHAG